MLYGKGAASYTYTDLTDEIFSEMQADELVEMIGRTAVCGKLGNEYQQYTYGAYIDRSAEELEYLKLAAGRFPSASGEVTLYDYILEDMFFTTEPTSYIGKEITLSQFDFGAGNATGELVGELTLKVVGVICTDELREQKEYGSGWIGHTDFSVKSMPVIYLFSGDCNITDKTRTYTLVRLYNDDILTKEQNDISYKFLIKYNEKYKIAPSGREGIRSAAESVADFAVGSEDIQTQIYQSDTMTVIKYFSVIAIAVSAISLFGILFSVMPVRMRSLGLIRKIGCSKSRVAAIILTEWLFLLICGIAVGLIAGIALYELVLWVQDRFMGLSPLRGYTAEWAVLQVTDDPFISAVLCSVCMFALGYAVYFIRFLGKKKDKRKSGKVRSLSRILLKLSGNTFAGVMQVLSLALVLFAAIMCYSYYTIDGKGGGYFTDSELNGDAYYNYANVNMRDCKTDICIYSAGGGGLFGLSVVEDQGLPADTVNKISQIDGVHSIQSYVVNTAFNLFYPKASKEVPAKISQFYAELLKDADEILYPDERNYYNIPAVFGNQTAMDRLSDYVTDGEIGTYKNGLTMVFYERDGISLYPYNIGDRVNSIALDGSLDHQGHDMEFIIEAIAVIPETAKENAPITYSAFDSGNGLTFAAPQETAVFLETYKEKYNNAYISLDEDADINSVTSQIQRLLDSSMKVKLQTINECDEAYRSSYIARFASVIVLFVILVLMAVIGYHSMISMRLQISKQKIAVLRAIGLSKRRWNKTFLLQNIFNTLVSCTIGTVLVYIFRFLISSKYDQALKSFGYPESDLFGASAEVYKLVNDLNSTYLFEYEIQNAPVILPLIVLSLSLVILSAVISCVLLNGNKNESIISQLSQRTKE
ncbi:MAG: FtsX-like permease family protein [Oscillospiraceae bacterium]